MKCTNCGATLEPGASECQFCGTPVQRASAVEPATATTPGSGAIQPTTKTSVLNPLLDKTYEFSGNDLIIRGRWGVNTTVKVGDDRLFFETVPAKKNKVPAAMLEDIMAIKESFYMRTANIVIAVIGFLCIFAQAYWGLLVSALVLLLYRERKVEIFLRNGNKITIYDGKKENTQGFVNDMKTITKIS